MRVLLAMWSDLEKVFARFRSCGRERERAREDEKMIATVGMADGCCRWWCAQTPSITPFCVHINFWWRAFNLVPGRLLFPSFSFSLSRSKLFSQYMCSVALFWCSTFVFRRFADCLIFQIQWTEQTKCPQNENKIDRIIKIECYHIELRILCEITDSSQSPMSR